MGFQIHPVTAVLQLELIVYNKRSTSMLHPCVTFFADKNINIDSALQELALKLRQLAVKEWLENPEDYQGFLTMDDETNSEVPLVIHEAPKFLQPGYVHDPLANTMVTAISNIPVIIFSFALHHPIIISPRKCAVSSLLYAAFNPHGEGHYDAITFQEQSTSTTTAPQCCDVSFEFQCRCGVNIKKGKEHCKKMEGKYTTCIRCPCLQANQWCTDSRQCRGCANPCGVRAIANTGLV